MVLDQLDQSDITLWSLLVFSGYLRAERVILARGKPPLHRVSIPNTEVRQVYTSSFERWFDTRTRGHGADQRRLLDALLNGDAEALELQLGALLANVISYHDFPAHDLPERFYQAFLLGLLCALEPDYRVRSNRESGKGRPDVQIFPSQAGRPGVLLELKVARGKTTLERALADGVAQARTKGYRAELLAAGAEPVHALALAFDGKELRVAAID